MGDKIAMTSIFRLNRDIEELVLRKMFITSNVPSFYVSDRLEHMPESALLLTNLGKAGYYLTLQKDTREWLFNLWRITDDDFACAAHGNSIEEVLYNAMVMLVHQVKEADNV